MGLRTCRAGLVVFHTTAPVLRTCPLSEGRQWGVWLLASASWDYYYAAWGLALGGTAVRESRGG